MRIRGIDLRIKGVNLAPYLRYARLWLLLAAAPALVAGLVGYVRANHGPTTYDASATLYVQQSTQANYGPSGIPDIYSSTQLAQTYSALATQPVVEQQADRLLASRYPGYQVESHALRSATPSVQQTPLIVLTLTDTLPGRAAAAVNAVAQAFIAQVKHLNQSRFASDEQSLTVQMNREQKAIDQLTNQIAGYHGSSVGLSNLKTSLSAHQNTYQSLLNASEQLKLTRDEVSSSVDVYSPATPPAGPNAKHGSRTALTWAFLVLLLGSAGIYAYEYLNDLPRSIDDVEAAANAPVLGAIPGIPGDSRETAHVAAGKRRSAAAEAYRLVRTNIQFIDIDHPPCTIVVTSPQPEEGKSTTASNLALAFAEGGKKTALVDGDLRRPSLQRLFDDAPHDGLTNLLLGEGLNGHVRPSPEQPNLVIITSGPIPPNSADLLNSDRMRETLQALREQSDIVIIDSPPLLPIADATILSALVDGVVLVVDPNKTHRRDIQKSREAIEAVGGRVLGVVINRVKAGTGLSYPYAEYYYGDSASGHKASSSSDRLEDGVVPAGRGAVDAGRR